MARVIRGRKEIGAQIGGLKAFMSAGEVFMMNDQKPIFMPLEVIPLADGWLVLRIGRTTYCFDADGEYDGVEVLHDMKDELFERELLSMLKASRNNRGKPALPPYFDGKNDRGDRLDYVEPVGDTE